MVLHRFGRRNVGIRYRPHPEFMVTFRFDPIDSILRFHTPGRVVVGGLAALLLMGACTSPRSPTDSEAVTFEKHVLSDEFVAEGVAVGDVNEDGRPDVVAGSHWYEAPDWTPRPYRPVRTFPDTVWADAFFHHLLDVDGDDHPDILRIDFPGEGFYWYQHPGPDGLAEDVEWTRRRVHPSVNNEVPRFVDVDEDDRDEVIFADGTTRQMVWFDAEPTGDSTRWNRHPISVEEAPGTSTFSHGIGFEDLDGDEREDVIVRSGWWSAPANPTDSNWTFHSADLGEPASQIYTHDYDGDGDRDVVSASAHDYGIWWHERIAGPDADSSWTTRLIHDDFSQTHALVQADVDEDGDPDLITGKRYFAHNGKDPGGTEPAVLYWFEFERTESGPRWTPHRIDDDSGVGVEIEYVQVIGDERPDIVVANKKGVFIFERTS